MNILCDGSFFFFLIEKQLTYNIVLVSDIQDSDWVFLYIRTWSPHSIQLPSVIMHSCYIIMDCISYAVYYIPVSCLFYNGKIIPSQLSKIFKNSFWLHIVMLGNNLATFAYTPGMGLTILLCMCHLFKNQNHRLGEVVVILGKRRQRLRGVTSLAQIYTARKWQCIDSNAGLFDSKFCVLFHLTTEEVHVHYGKFKQYREKVTCNYIIQK